MNPLLDVKISTFASKHLMDVVTAVNDLTSRSMRGARSVL